MPVSAAITFRMAMGSGYVAVMRGTPVTPHCRHDDASPDYRPKFRVFTEKANTCCIGFSLTEGLKKGWFFDALTTAS